MVAEYHESVVDYYEGRRPDVEEYSLDLEAALEDLRRSGDIRFKKVTLENVIYSKEKYSLVKKTAEVFYKEAIDITWNPEYGSPLVLEVYYYPNHEEAIQRLIAELRKQG